MGDEIIMRSKQQHIFAFVVLLCLPEYFKQYITISKLVKYVQFLVHTPKQDGIAFVGFNSLYVYLLACELRVKVQL